MEKQELTAEFKSKLEDFERFQGFIQKAQEKADKFSPEVVAKVVADNTAKIEGVASVLNPLVGELQGVIAGIEAERAEVSGRVDAAKLALEELELRKEIGELDDDEFATEAKTHNDEIEASSEVATALGTEFDELSSLLQRWLDARPSGVAAADEEDAFGGDEAFEGVEGRGEGVHAEKVEGLADDVSAVFDDDADGSDDEEAPAEDGLTFEMDADDDSAIALGDAEEEPSLDFDDEPASVSDEALDEAPSSAGEGEGAMLILGEGTDDEHVYPFTGEVISLGRGRDNTIQVKNDSKVSRYHCKLFMRDGVFFIEDNKSANGTLVDGELITEKRLEGGEEIIIGESFFRFRTP